ncbi:hypothetical protein AGLY_005525 [Aphis glycines]|uniref:Uncharacterized protein n=1 Tax=Aphis glycines TaxID=307491 RepID=A0A6G0TWL9_APHGL|nr:hypothetical protein AGLY_005525 [Aphis glycines]
MKCYTNYTIFTKNSILVDHFKPKEFRNYIIVCFAACRTWAFLQIILHSRGRLSMIKRQMWFRSCRRANMTCGNQNSQYNNCTSSCIQNFNFLNSLALILKINHLPHSYQPVMHKLVLMLLLYSLKLTLKLIPVQQGYLIPSLSIAVYHINYGRNQPIDKMMSLTSYSLVNTSLRSVFSATGS